MSWKASALNTEGKNYEFSVTLIKFWNGKHRGSSGIFRLDFLGLPKAKEIIDGESDALVQAQRELEKNAKDSAAQVTHFYPFFFN